MKSTACQVYYLHDQFKNSLKPIILRRYAALMGLCVPAEGSESKGLWPGETSYMALGPPLSPEWSTLRRRTEDSVRHHQQVTDSTFQFIFCAHMMTDDLSWNLFFLQRGDCHGLPPTPKVHVSQDVWIYSHQKIKYVFSFNVMCKSTVKRLSCKLKTPKCNNQ